MKKKPNSKRHLLAATCAFALAFSLVAMSACSPSADEATSESANPKIEIKSKADSDPTSLMAIATHPEGTFTDENILNPGTCMQAGCHDAAEIVEDGEGLLVDPQSGTVANPHANHQYLQCTDCHYASNQATLYCNSCHEFTLADGWADPALGGAELGYEFDASGCMGLSYQDSGRDATVLPEEVINPEGL